MEAIGGHDTVYEAPGIGIGIWFGWIFRIGNGNGTEIPTYTNLLYLLMNKSSQS